MPGLEHEQNRSGDEGFPDVLLDVQAQWIHFVLGCCILLPWNVMITATPYFLSRLTDSSFKGIFISSLSVVFTASRFVFLAHATVSSKHVSPSRRVQSCIMWLSILCLLLTLSTYVRLPTNTFIAFTLAVAACQAAVDSYLQTSVFAVASLYGPQALQATMSGQAAVAVAVSAVQVMSTAIFVQKRISHVVDLHQDVDGQEDESSARVFFALSTFFLLFSGFAHQLLASKPAHKALVSPLERYSSHGVETEHLIPRARPEPHTDGKHHTLHVLHVARANLIYEVAVAYVFIVTMAVFPPITTLVHPTNPAFHPLLFNAIHFLVFNVGDFFGRYLCSIPRLIIWSAKWLLAMSLSRTIFIPIFLMCNVQRTSSQLPQGAYINSDVLFLLILFAFGLSNGYVSSLCMMSAPSLDHNPRLQGRREDVDVAATVANFSLVGGLVLGSAASFAVVAAMCNCNPFIL